MREWVAQLANGGVALTASVVATAAIRRHALKTGILDEPSHRSSHQQVKPRGGGVGLLIGVVAGGTVGAWLSPGATEALGVPHLLAALAVLLTAGVGWLDDQGDVRPRTRIQVHAAAGCLLVPLAFSAGPGDASLLLSAAVAAWWVFATVSGINVVNFMDGIDGIIGLQAVILGIHLAGLSGTSSSRALAVAMVGASAGFLVLNWPPARIFMGDVGSGSLGVLGMVLGLMVLGEGHASVWGVFLPLAPLFTDASVTMVRRIFRRERLSEAHRQHLYQRLANGGWGHAPVALAYGGAAVAGSLLVRWAGAAPSPTLVLGFLLMLLFIGATLELRLRSGPEESIRS